MSGYISTELRRQVREDAGERCGYCLSSEKLTGFPLEIEHIVPEALGGETVRENLWLACSANVGCAERLLAKRINRGKRCASCRQRILRRLNWPEKRGVTNLRARVLPGFNLVNPDSDKGCKQQSC